MQSTVAAVTMLKDDLFFLKKWLRYYGDMFGRENCYIVSHGREESIAHLATGCNIIGIPNDVDPRFDIKRWRLLNSLANGLLSYYKHVIVGDVDEIVVMDPINDISLLDYLTQTKGGRILTPIGLEVIHRTDLEKSEIQEYVIGPRRYARLAPEYSKPCVLSVNTKLSRGGHFSRFSKLFSPGGLFLLHLKYCDFANYVEVANRRNALCMSIDLSIAEASIGRHWFPQTRGSDKETFRGFASLPESTGFRLNWVRNDMKKTWRPRGTTTYWEFDRPIYNRQYRIPDRFVGLV